MSSSRSHASSTPPQLGYNQAEAIGIVFRHEFLLTYSGFGTKYPHRYDRTTIVADGSPSL